MATFPFSLSHLAGSCLGTAVACLSVVMVGDRVLAPAPAVPARSVADIAADRTLNAALTENQQLRRQLWDERCRTADLAGLVAKDRVRREQMKKPFVPATDDRVNPADYIPAPIDPIPVPMVMPASKPGGPISD